MFRTGSPFSARMSTITSRSTESFSRLSSLHTRRDTDRTESSLSPFLSRLDDHMSLSSFSTADKRDSHLRDSHLRVAPGDKSPSLPGSTLSSSRSSSPPEEWIDPDSALPSFRHAASLPRAPVSASPLRVPEMKASDERRSDHSVKFSSVARRHLSKLGRISRDVDNDSVISEPASYSNGAFVASDMWLVQKDVQPAESALADKQRRRRQRMKQLDDPRALRQAVSVSAANPSIYDEDKETGSSRLVNQFFSGGLSPYLGCPRRNERIGSADLWSDNNVTRGFPDTDIANYRYPEKDEQEYPYYSTKQDTYSTEPARHTEFGAAGRKISRARRLRWWIRRVSYRVRGEWEYV